VAQLSKDSFSGPDALMPVDAAVRRLGEAIPCVAEVETVGLTAADGRVLAASLTAPIDLPSFDNSAVDGYAVRFADLAPTVETHLPVIGRVAAGHLPPPEAAGPHAVRVFTGAPMPAGMDTVFMQEDCRVEADGRVALPPGLAKGANRRPAGEDLQKGAKALSAGRRLAPEDVALAAALGVTALSVRRRLRVAVFSTGDEIVAPGAPLRPAAVYDANRFLLMSLLGRLGVVVTDLGILPDRAETIAAALRAAAPAHDLILTSGGVSTGEEDHVKAAVAASGSLVFWRLAIKPGRPVAMGVIDGAAFVGLPGNPVAVFVTFAYVVRPLIAALSGARDPGPLPLPVAAGFAYRKKPGRREYVRVRLEGAAKGLVALQHPVEGAGVLTSLTRTDGLVELPEDVVAVRPGDSVGFMPYALLR
jgi:molybdopterin molybdotransferase